MNKRMREIKERMEILNKEAVEFYNSNDFENAEKRINEIENLEKEYKIAEKLFKTDKETVEEEMPKNTVDKKIVAFANGIRNAATKMNETTGTEGGYTVPEDVVTDIEHLREAKESLQDLVTVENVTTMSGKRTYKKRSQMTGFSEVGEGKKIGAKATPQYALMEYKIKKYAGIYPTTNELLEDSDANIYNELTSWIADESRVTRNKLIINAIKTNTETDLKDLDGIKKALNVTLGAAFKATSKIITNDDGLQYLDTLKDEKGNYLLQPSASDPMKLVLCAGANTIPVKVFPNADMPTDGEKVPFTIGDLKEGIKLFDRKRINILASNTAVVGSDEDVEVRDKDAFVNGYITVTP